MLIDVTDCLRYLNLDAVMQSQIAGILAAVDAEVKSHLGWNPERKDYSVKIESGHRVVSLNARSVNSVSGIWYDLERVFDPVASLVDERTYFVDAEIGVIYFDDIWFGQQKVRGGLKIDFNAGYDPVPEDLKKACVEFASWIFRRTFSGNVGVRTSTAVGMSAAFDMTLPLSILSTLTRYQVQGVASG